MFHFQKDRFTIYFIILLMGLMACDQKVPQKESISALKTSGYSDPTDTVINELMGKFDPIEHPDFVSIANKYADREGLLLRNEAYQAFIAMENAANKDSVHLQIRSATRNFDYQKGIWERKWNGKTLLDGDFSATTIANQAERALAILRYSSMPGTSRHHWGTDIDLNSFNNDYFEEGEGKRIYDWLQKYAAQYGFCQPYTAFDADRTTGYQEEKWHWSYMPLSARYTELAKNFLKDEMIQGFEGANTASEIEIVKNYILGIHPDCFY